MKSWKRCMNCKKWIDPNVEGDLQQVRHTNGRYFHKDCLELYLWRKESPIFKQTKKHGKAGHAVNGRVIRSTRGLT
jgi:hypothetical protein